ncbi:hypothetical protein HMPREF1477_00982 [Veillonella sp. HPA0037]|jgi:hypothetical protein|uniref:hypothetical protein n=1 Tax=Veillonella TaxID=29465 RepID=UPI00034EC4F6|nr:MULTISPECIES: hypothetical protein [Veillonella]EPD79354.1 hypothetical protein HMPREF1477_00982 [Veillonella sp. HPA0037]
MKKNKKETIDIKAKVYDAEPGMDQLVNIDTSEYTEENLSDLITTRIDALNDLEKHILEAEEAADAAIKEADDVKNGIIDYGIFWDSIDTDRAIEKLQNAVISTAKALEESSDAHKKTFEYQKRLTNISYGLFRLGATNIAYNRSLVREIELRLKGASEKEISELARNELVRVVTQLKEQEDLQKKLARLKEEVKTLKKSQNDINDSLTVIDADKDILDQKIEGLIKQLLDYRALLKDNIERTEKILCQVDLNETNFKNILAELDSKIDDQNNANKVSIENNRAMILGLKGDLDKYQAQFTLLVEADNANKESHENNKSMIIGLQNDFFKYQKQLSSLIEENNTNKTCNELNKSMIVDLQDELNRNRELFSKQSLSIDNNINSKASKINFYILAVLLLLNIVVSIVVYCYK